MTRPACLLALLIAAASAQEDALSTANVYRRAAPATIHVRAVGVGGGSGFVVDPSGVAVTCYHLIARPPRLGGIEVHRPDRVPDGTERWLQHAARVVAVDGRRDAIVLALETDRPLPALELAGPSSVETGDEVAAIGHPSLPDLPLPSTLTRGVVSFAHRSIGEVDHLQIDLAINDGMSGGPVLDRAGRLVGMVALRFEDRRGISFAVGAGELAAVLAADRTEDPAAPAAVGRVAARWLELVGDGRIGPAGELIAPYYWHAQVPAYRDLLALLTGLGGPSEAADEALRRRAGAPHSGRLLADVIGSGEINRPAIRRYLVALAAADLGRWRTAAIERVRVAGALAEAIVSLDGRPVVLRLVLDRGDWLVVPFRFPDGG